MNASHPPFNADKPQGMHARMSDREVAGGACDCDKGAHCPDGYKNKPGRCQRQETNTVQWTMRRGVGNVRRQGGQCQCTCVGGNKRCGT